MKAIKSGPSDKLVRIFYKDGDSTMLIAKGVPLYQARHLESVIKQHLHKSGAELKGRFIYTQ